MKHWSRLCLNLNGGYSDEQVQHGGEGRAGVDQVETDDVRDHAVVQALTVTAVDVQHKGAGGGGDGGRAQQQGDDQRGCAGSGGDGD